MKCFKFRIEPVAKGRPRAKIDGFGHPYVYTPSETVKYEKALREMFLSSTDEELPVFKKGEKVTVYLEFGMPITKTDSKSKKKKAACLSGEIAHTKKPDLDNLVKAVCDALNGCLWEDDSSIISVTAEKFYTEEPYVLIRVRR